jgi:hypothetical protein
MSWGIKNLPVKNIFEKKNWGVSLVPLGAAWHPYKLLIVVGKPPDWYL